MFGAILGDIVGSPYEFGQKEKTKEFELFTEKSRFTDDSLMTLAIAEGLMHISKEASVSEIQEAVIESMKKWGRKYPDAGFGGRFKEWLQSEEATPYHSYGNGAAMRISSVGWLYDSWERTREVAIAVTEVTHDHPEGLKGAVAVAGAIYLARHSMGKEAIEDFIENEIGYDLFETLDGIRPKYETDVSCQGSVPQSIIAFLESESTEDAIRNAVSLGGDTDTMGCIAGSIGEAYYGVPAELQEKCYEYLPEELQKILREFQENFYVYGTEEYRLHKNLMEWTDWEAYDKKEEVSAEDYRKLLEDCVQLEDSEALEIMAYGCYNGNSVYSQDYVRARDCLLRLIELNKFPRADWYNTLGYIYYYGRCNHGEGQYEEAFRYFSLGALSGVHESMHKMADLLQEGKGVPKNYALAKKLLAQAYGESREEIIREDFDGDFPNAALRIGKIYEFGLGEVQDLKGALIFYMQAEYAMKERRKNIHLPYDASIEKKIEEALRRVRGKLTDSFFKDVIRTDSPFLIGQMLADSEGIELTLFERNDESYIVARTLTLEEPRRKYLFTVPEVGFCELSDTIMMRIEGLEDYKFYDIGERAAINEIHYDGEKKEWHFGLQGQTKLRLKCEGFTFRK